jgi:hypothetical protein
MHTILTIDDPQISMLNQRSGLDRRQAGETQPERVDRRRGADRRSPATNQSAGPLAGAKRKRWFGFRQSHRAADPADIQSGAPGGDRQTDLTDADAYKQRAAERTAHEAPLVFEDMEIHHRYDAALRNFSPHGLCLETEHAPRVGTAAVIHMTNYSPQAAAPEDLRKYYVQIVWVKKLSGMLVFNRYAVGAKRCANLDEFFALFAR